MGLSRNWVLQIFGNGKEMSLVIRCGTFDRFIVNLISGSLQSKTVFVEHKEVNWNLFIN